jgi:hypothetical protein
MPSEDGGVKQDTTEASLNIFPRSPGSEIH